MSYTLAYKPSVERELAKLPRSILQRADAAIQELTETPRPPGCIKLTGVDAYRLRVGDYRIVYTIDDPGRLVVIHAVRHRREVYRGL
jgi:mRNA interferase RelE/StbE